MKLNDWLVKPSLTRVTCTALLVSLTACGGGGGGTTAPLTPEATVSAIGSAQVLRGISEDVMLQFPITMSKPVVTGVTITYKTASLLQQSGPAGRAALGFAVAGDTCGAGVDYIRPPTSASVIIPAGATSGTIAVKVCASSSLKATQKLSLNWSSVAQNGTQTGLIVNAVAGGLASSATTTGVANTPSFGRDNNTLTNANTDGHAGLSYTQKPSNLNWQCTQDNVTGLVWQANPAINNGSNNASFNTYAKLTAYIAQINQSAPCGNSNWRLPSTNELASLVDFSVSSGVAADAFAFPLMQAARYWTAERLVGTTTDAWFVDFANQGAMGYDLMTPPASNAYTNYQVILVSAPAPALASCTTANAQYLDNNDGTVTDQATQLMWKQCAEGAQGPSCTGTKIAMTSIAQMTERVNIINNDPANAGLGYADWRVPTVKELSSLVNRTCTTSTINTVAFPNNDAISHITATVFAPTPAWVWVVDFSSGTISPANLTSAGGRALRLVRAGQ